MGYNKFITKSGTVLLDLTSDEITPEDVREGVNFHGRDGESYTGTMATTMVGFTDAELNEAGELILFDSENNMTNLGSVVGKDGTNGTDGISLENVTLDDEGNLSVTYGGTTNNLGNIKGQKGQDGTNGLNGKSAYDYAKENGYTGTENSFSQMLNNIVNKQNISLGFHSDGLLYLFIDGEPVGTGIAQNSGVSSPIVGFIDANNNIVLTGDLDYGTYSFKYENEDGSYTEIGTLNISEEAAVVNLVSSSLNLNGTEIYNNIGYKNGTYISMDSGENQPSKDSGDTTTVATGLIPYNWETLYVKGISIDANTSHCRAQLVTANYTVEYQLATGSTPWANVITIEELGTGYYKLSPKVRYDNIKYIRFSFIGSGENLFIATSEIN